LWSTLWGLQSIVR